jgi:hypothetical protein
VAGGHPFGFEYAGFFSRVVRGVRVGGGRQGRLKHSQVCSFFEKKEPKKLLFFSNGADSGRPWPENKSLLLLFFRKEGLSFFSSLITRNPA